MYALVFFLCAANTPSVTSDSTNGRNIVRDCVLTV